MIGKSALALMALLLGTMSTAALAQPTFSVTSGSGGAGSVSPVVLNMNWESDGTVVVADLVVTYDSANLSVTESCSGVWQCNDNGSGTVIVLGFDGNAVLDSGPVGTLSFNISGAVPGTYPINVVVTEYGDADAQLVTGPDAS